MRWSLRTFFLLFTIATAFFGWRLNERRDLTGAAKQIETLGGINGYRWQSPTVVPAMARVLPGYQRTVNYTVTLPDGSTETRTRTVGYTVWNYVQVQEVKASNADRPASHIRGFFRGTHDDIAVDVVTIAVSDVNQELAQALTKLRGLRKIVLRLDRSYYQELSASADPNLKHARDEELAKAQAPVDQAIALIKEELPKVEIARGIVPGYG